MAFSPQNSGIQTPRSGRNTPCRPLKFFPLSNEHVHCSQANFQGHPTPIHRVTMNWPEGYLLSVKVIITLELKHHMRPLQDRISMHWNAMIKNPYIWHFFSQNTGIQTPRSATKTQCRTLKFLPLSNEHVHCTQANFPGPPAPIHRVRMKWPEGYI